MAKFGNIASWLGGRRQVVALVLAGWIALVVMSAGSKSSDDSLFRLPDLRILILGLVLVTALCGLVILPFLFRSQEGPLERRPPKSPLSLLAIAAIIVVLVLALNPDVAFAPPTEEEQEAGGAVPQEETTEPLTEQPAQLGNLALLLVACAGTGAVLLWSRHRLGTPADPVAESDDRDLDLQIESAIDDASQLLSSGDDPRASVLAAYASLERALADQDRPRRHSETATEHLGRVLQSFPSVAGPAVKLGQLYELARYSYLPITTADQHEAADALRRSRNKLSDKPSTTI